MTEMMTELRNSTVYKETFAGQWKLMIDGSYPCMQLQNCH